MKFLLASASPRRRALLQEAGYDFEVVIADVAERTPPHLTVSEVTLYNARIKAFAVAKQHRHCCVLAADTLVSHQGKILGKPVDLTEAFEMLRRLSGSVHEVFTGVCIHTPEHAIMFVEVSYVRFRALSDAEIHEYMAVAGPLDKAGAYAAQENHLNVIECIEGSKSNVIGLPMEHIVRVHELDFARRTACESQR